MYTANKPIKLILDTDMGNDIDDALALAMLHNLEARGECQCLGITVSKSHPSAPAMVDAINTFYGRGDIPIGMVQKSVTPDPGLFNEPVLTMTDNTGLLRFPRTHSRNNYEPAVDVLRRLLSESENNSVVIVLIGFSTNLFDLIHSEPDTVSSLTGMELFTEKVSHVVMMAGSFDGTNTGEYNIIKDQSAATSFIQICPRPIYFTGYEIGRAITYPARSILEDFRWTTHHPVAEGYKRFMKMPYDRPTWDLTAILHAVRPDRNYFRVIGPGHVTINEQCHTHFEPDASGKHFVLAATPTQCEVVRHVQVELTSQPIVQPANTPAVSI